MKPGENGWLVPHDSPKAWADALARLCEMGAAAVEPSLAAVRTMREVARDTFELYGGLAGTA